MQPLVWRVRERRNLATLALSFGLALLLGGCSMSGAGGSRPAQTTQVAMPPSYRFEPTVVQVPAHSTVTWTNSDNFSHSVKVEDSSEVHVAKPGESVHIVFDRPGTYPYVCTFHSQNMRGTVVVV